MAFGGVQPRQVTEYRCRQGLFGEVPVGQSGGLSINRFGLRVLPFREIDRTKIVERGGKVALLVARAVLLGCFFIDRHEAAIKRLGLLVTLCVAVKSRKVHQTFLHFGVIRSKHLLTNGQRPLVERHGIGFSPFEVVEDPEIIEAGGQVGVIRVERFLADRQRPFIKRLGLGVLALISIERPEIVEARGNLRIVGSHPFADLERPLVKRLRIAQISHFFVNHG